MSERSGDTRERIKAIALELFSEQGYEQTSLREIAERLGVTKAALYYHFKSKEEIAEAFVAERIEVLQGLTEWARSQPPGVETRAAFIRKYAPEITSGRFHSLMRFAQENQHALKGTAVGVHMREQMQDLIEALAGPDATPADTLRCGYAVLLLHSSWFLLQRSKATDDERSAAALEVALDLIQSGGPAPASAPAT